MFGSAIIEVIIGIIFIYILLSLLVSQINQVIANTLNIRGEQLRKRIADVITDKETLDRLLQHPVVGVVKSNPNDTLKTQRVSNLSSENFAKSLINVLGDPYLNMYSAITTLTNEREKDQIQGLVNLLRVNTDDSQKSAEVLSRLHKAIISMEPEDRQDRRSLLRAFGGLQAAIRNMQYSDSGLLTVLDGISNVKNRSFQQAMETVLNSTNTLYDAQASIERWYDQKMEQTKDMYTRTMQTLSLLMGLILAITLNVDSLFIGQALWNDPILRQNIVAAVNDSNLSTMLANLETTTDENGNVVVSDDSIAQIEASLASADQIFDEIIDLRVPLGWDLSFDRQNSIEGRSFMNLLPGTTNGVWYINLLVKLAGILITGFAVAQGAPFWFDVLRRITNK